MLKKNLFLVIICFFIFRSLSLPCWGEQNNIPTEEINITANRIKTLLENTGSSVTVITKKQIKKSKKRYLKDYLQEVPGLTITPTGPVGQLATVSIRGALSGQTLVLVDGIPVNDPASPNGEFNFGGILMDDVEKVEVVRGPQSTIYGSKGIGGVINIITNSSKFSRKPRFKICGKGEMGGYASSLYSLNVSGSNPWIGYSVGLSGSGFSRLSVSGERYGNTEFDPFHSFNLYSNVKMKLAKRAESGILYKTSDKTTNLDLGGGPLADIAGYWTKSNSNLVKGNFDYKIIEDLWDASLLFSVSDINRKVYGSPYNPPGFVENYYGKIYNYAFRNKIRTGTHTILAGYQRESESAIFTDFDPNTFLPTIDPRRKAHTDSFYLQDNFNLDKKVFFSAGIRNDNHSTAGGETTYRVSFNYHITKDLFFKGSAGSGFKAPTLYQLYSSYGNLNLRPERSHGWDTGLEYQSRNRRHKIGLTYFSNNLDDLIDLDFVNLKYFNVNKAKTWGWEAYGKTKITPRFSLGANYTNLNTKDETTKMQLLRRPKNKFVFATDYKLIPKKVNLHADAVYTGEREDLDFSSFPGKRIKLSPYTLINATVSYKINRNLEAYIRGENIFNKKYETVWGYSYPGAALFGGLNINF